MNYLYRMTHIDNIPHILKHGITHRTSALANPDYVAIGDTGLIERRLDYCVKTVRGNVYRIGDFIPFYFYARMPMLYNIQHGYGVDMVNADDIVYMIVDMSLVAGSGRHRFFFSDGHAYNHLLTRFYDMEDFDKIDELLDEVAIKSNDWGSDSYIKNRKQAEFFVKGDVEAGFIRCWICHSEPVKERLAGMGIDGESVLVRPNAYF
ncbi:MAG: DUF4433 domain-containing protein [Prevotella sp.]